MIEAAVAITAGISAASTALIAFGLDSLIETVSGIALLRRLTEAGIGAPAEEHHLAERRALYLVAATFYLLGFYVLIESGFSLYRRETAAPSVVGLALSILSLIIMPLLAAGKPATHAS